MIWKRWCYFKKKSVESRTTSTFTSRGSSFYYKVYWRIPTWRYQAKNETCMHVTRSCEKAAFMRKPTVPSVVKQNANWKWSPGSHPGMIVCCFKRPDLIARSSFTVSFIPVRFSISALRLAIVLPSSLFFLVIVLLSVRFVGQFEFLLFVSGSGFTAYSCNASKN